jgi:hypothetical protein
LFLSKIYCEPKDKGTTLLKRLLVLGSCSCAKCFWRDLDVLTLDWNAVVALLQLDLDVFLMKGGNDAFGRASVPGFMDSEELRSPGVARKVPHLDTLFEV